MSVDLNLNFLMIKIYGPKNQPPGCNLGPKNILGLVSMIQIRQVSSECGPSNLVVLGLAMDFFINGRICYI